MLFDYSTNISEIFIYIVIAIVVIVAYEVFLYFSIPFNKSPDPATLNPSLYESSYKDKIILITGGNTGIGKETAKILSLTKASIVLGCRSKKRGEIAKKEIIKYNNGTNKNIDVLHLDLSSIQLIDKFIHNFKSRYGSLDILICNAAINPLKNGLKTKDGLELAFGVNYIGHMHLVLNMKHLMQSTNTTPSRIIVVAGVPYLVKRFNQIFDINKLNGYNKWDAYCISTMEKIMFTREFAKRYPIHNNNQDAYIMSSHPGVGITDLFNERYENKDIIKQPNGVLSTASNLFLQLFGDTLEQLSYTQVYLALTDIRNLKHGGHYRNDEIQKLEGGVVDNNDLINQLWDKSKNIIDDIQKNY